MTVFWSRAHRQRHVTICLMKADIQLKCKPVHNQCAITLHPLYYKTTIIWRDSDSSWRCVIWAMAAAVWVVTGRCASPSHRPAATHAAAAVDRVCFLTVHGTSLLVSDRYWIAEAEAADFTKSIQSNFGWIIRPLVFYGPDALPLTVASTVSVGAMKPAHCTDNIQWRSFNSLVFSWSTHWLPGKGILHSLLQLLHANYHGTIFSIFVELPFFLA